MLAIQSIIAIFFSLALRGMAKSVDSQPNYPEPEFVLRPDDVSMHDFEKQFLVLCPKYYGESEATDRPIFIFQTFQERFDKDVWHGHKAAVQCIYQVPTGEYWNIGASVATDLGGSALATLYADAE